MKNINSLLKLSAVFVAIIMISMAGCQKEANNKSIPVPKAGNANYSLGCEMLPASEYAKIPQAKVPEISAKPTIINLNVPPVGDQGSEGSCVAFGTTYAARSINWQTSHTAAWSNAVNIFSPEFVYNQIKLNSSCGSGSYVVNGLNFLKATGVCTWATMPYVDGNCSVMPNATQTTEAANYKITSYNTVAINANTIKSFLAAGKPVIVAGPVNSAFMNLQNNAVLDKFTGHSLGGHCYCLVGYNDTKNAFKFMNSWGASWASAGFGYIAYGHISQWWTEAYVIN